MKINSRVAQRLRYVREHPLDPETGQVVEPLSQQMLAKKLDSSPSTLSQYEATEDRDARRNPSLEMIERWAEACGYRLVLRLVPEVSAAEVLHRLDADSPEKRALVSLFMQVVEHQPPDTLRTVRAVLQALAPASVTSLESSAPASEDALVLRAVQRKEDAS